MDYCHWNKQLGDYFFGENSRDRKVIMCVTRDTLAEVSDLPPEEALKDFVAAVCEGPEWNRIRGCTLLETKVHCCLHVDPQWGMHWSDAIQNPPGVQELQDLSAHVHWEKNASTQLDVGHPDRYPPYLAYLAAFVLAWTERKPNRNGNDYYETVLDLLDEHRQRWKDLPQFYRRYRRGGIEYTMNEVWKDLLRFCQTHSRAELVLPDAVLRPPHYVHAPKFLGLMKASNLRSLDKLFAAMEEAKILNPDFVPPGRVLVERVAHFSHVNTYLSSSCVNNLRGALDANDPTLTEAYSRLLQAKYRDFDGLPEESQDGPESERPRSARLLRVMDRNGSIKLVCRLRSEGALKKLPLEEDVRYVFEGQGHRVVMSWISESEWFSPVDVQMEDPMGQLELKCSALRIRAAMSAKEFVVLHNPSLYFLARSQVEVNEVEKGRNYILLAKGGSPPELGGIKMVRMNVASPQGMSCWSLNVPADASSKDWPPQLPPLLEEKVPLPKLSFSGFRLRPRMAEFPTGLPVSIRCSLEGLEVVLSHCDGCKDSAILQKEDDEVWSLISQKPGTITLRLLDREAQLPPDWWQDQIVSFVSLQAEGAAPPVFSEQLVSLSPAPNYPEVFLKLEGGVLDPRELHDGDTKSYFATTTCRFKLEMLNVHETELQVLVGGKPCKPVGPREYELPPAEAGKILALEVKSGHILLKGQHLKFTREPELEIKCASINPKQPTEVVHSLMATVHGEDGITFDWEVVDKGRRITAGQAGLGVSGRGKWSGILLEQENTGIEIGKVYEIRFGFAQMFSTSQWFKFRGGSSPRPSKDGPLGGFNSLENAFEKIALPLRKEGWNQ